ncbi:MAG TPA: hypothetical protein DCY94_02570 [Firmicutes bacterium]|nr:hypothetical protein [Bacillota bacterium]
MIIRKRELKDIESWVDVNISSWLDNLKDIVSPRIISIMNANREKRIIKERENFAEDDEHYVLENENGIIGILKIKKSDREGLEDCGEVQMLYLLTEFKNKGYGKILLEKAFAILKEKGFDKIVIGCLENNPSNEFYRHMGGTFLRQDQWNIFDEVYIENVYLYDFRKKENRDE